MLAFVIGGSANVRREIEAAYALTAPDMVIVVNDIGTSFRANFNHWVTLHPNNWERWLADRAVLALPVTFQRWSPLEMVQEKCGANYVDCFEPPLSLLPDFEPSGLSGLYAVKVALHVGATKVLLVGVPMDQSGHFLGNNPSKHWISPARHRAWLRQAGELRDKVRSVSGWTCEQFGPPTQQWLEEGRWQENASQNSEPASASAT